MQEIIAPVNGIRFEIEVALELQKGALPLPFPGMDKSGAAVCIFYLAGNCDKGNACPFRHIKGDRTIVCKHWLRGLCKKGDDCEFLHEYDMSKMPECFFYSKFGQCSNKECPFLHIDPENKLKDCPWYDRGFCRHGPLCKNRHVRRIMCQCYLNGFCLDGPDCKHVHPSFKIPEIDPLVALKKLNVVCHLCSEPGHKANVCPKKAPTGGSDEPYAHRQQHPTSLPHHHHHHHHHQHHHQGPGQMDGSKPPMMREKKPIDQVTCYKCGEKGHYANRCPKGHLAFLSTANYNSQHAGNAS